jgi:hypothetical protein
MGDLNAYHQFWCGEAAIKSIQINSSRKHSERIVDWFENFDFTLHNSPGIYTHFPRQVQGFSPSIIGLTLTSGIAPEMILSWSSDRNTTPSGHSISILYLNLAPGKPQTKQHWTKADWSTFSQILKESNMDLSNLSSEPGSLKTCANVHNIINKAIEAAVPLIQPGSKYSIWWTKELSEQPRYLLKLERILRTHQNKCQKLR